MGIKNKERRKAKRKRQQTTRAKSSSSYREERLSERDLVELVTATAVCAHASGDCDVFDRAVRSLTAEDDRRAQQLVNCELLDFMERDVRSLWERGWQPADVIRVIGRRLGGPAPTLATAVIAAEARRYAPATLDDGWAQQLQVIDAHVWWSRDEVFLDELAHSEGISRTEVVELVVKLLCAMDSFPEIPKLCPLPGAGRRTTAAAGEVEVRMLERVRALLAKAEATNFAEEAEAFTAKAQELMTRFSIDHAMLSSLDEGSHGRGPRACRIGIDDPYAAEKAVLLSVIADANASRAIWSKQLGFSTVFGNEVDLGLIELLYTSLLVQATSAMMRSGSRIDRFGRSRTRSFRQSFLLSYGHRIKDRLEEAQSAARAAALEEHGDRMLPVLAASEAAVREAVEAAFPNLTGFSRRVGNTEGWAAGKAAADVALLDVRDKVTEAS